MQKIWNVKKYDEEYIEKIMQDFKVSRMLAKLLVSRNIAYDDIDMFLKGDLSNLKDPYKIKDMDKFVQRIDVALKNNEKIVIYGDYDVDGVTSIVVMYNFLKELGINVDYYVPGRLEEGYGLNTLALKKIKKEGASLVITVDTGITAKEEVKYANSIGLDICITDHHECSEELPPAICVVNTKRKDDEFSFKMHAGVGIAFKCITALAMKYKLEENSYLKYLDLVAVGTISDIVSLTDENRIISKYGLKMMQETKNFGLKALFKISGLKEINSTGISFLVAPKINACGRLGSANVAVKLLLSKNEEDAYKYANMLELQNKERQMIEKQIFEEADKMIKERGLESKNSIVLMSDDWHNGVIGIVASRLVNIYSKPVILFGTEENKVKGSGRCQQGFSLYAAISKCSDLVEEFGGHELAAGLTIKKENFDKFCARFDGIVEKITAGKIVQVVEVDDHITKDMLNIHLIKDIEILKPNGQSNRIPLFLYKNLRVDAISTFKNEKHLKLRLYDSGNIFDAIAFAKGDRRDELKVSDKIDVLCLVEVNIFNTKKKVIQLIVQDFQKTV